jgi:uncharacterized protein YycO
MFYVELILFRKDIKLNFLTIFFMATFLLYNTLIGSEAYAHTFQSTTLAPYEQTEKEISLINVLVQNPLRDEPQNMSSYSQLLQIFDVFTKYNLTFIESLLAQVKNHDTLSGEDLFVLRRAVTTYYKINQKILEFAKAYDFGGLQMRKGNPYKSRNLPMIKAHLIWLSGHLLVLEHLERMHEFLYESDSNFRRIVKNALLDKSDTAQGISKTLSDLLKIDEYTVYIGESVKFSQQINLVRNTAADLKVLLAKDPHAISLAEIIINNKTAIEIAQGKNHFKMQNYNVTDELRDTFNKVTSLLSAFFGNVAGAIKWRTGYLYHNQMAENIARRSLQPMDILIEKSPFILTDTFIPGHFGHTAVYLGTEEQLRAINMWDHPYIIPYQNEIAKGKVILEAVRSGVRLNSLEEFLNVDELSIMRKSDALDNVTLLIEEITRVMDQMGKPYDFNFDISTLDKIVCSELIYIFFGTVHWPTRYRLGRPTITPDDVAEILFYKNTKFHLVNFMVSKKNQPIQMVDRESIADDLNYELRSADGKVLPENGNKTQKDEGSNSYWKKETKCFNVTYNGKDTAPYGNRACKTSYKEYYYAESDAI